MSTVKQIAYRDQNEMFYPDTCVALKNAAAAGEVDLHALAREHYPGERLAGGALEGIRTVGFWDARSDQSWGLDWHRNEGIELTYVAQGRLDFSVEREHHALRLGDLTITRPWQRHRVGRPHVAASRLYWLILDVGVRRPNQTWTWPSWCVLSESLLSQLTEVLQFNEQAVWAADRETRESFEKLGRAVTSELSATRETRIAIAVNELLLSILEMLQELRVPLDRSLASSRRSVEMFLDALPEQVGAPWTLESMAETCGLGRTQFTNYCRNLKNATPIEYLNRCRIQVASERLRRSTQSVTDIAFQCGFESSQYFATVFRRHTGVSPSRFRDRDRTESG